MGKISKYSNLYDKDGNFLHGPGIYTTKELKELLKTLPKYSREWASVTNLLMQRKDDYDEEYEQAVTERHNTLKQEVIDTLKDIDITESDDSSNKVKDEGITHEPGVQGSDAKTV